MDVARREMVSISTAMEIAGVSRRTIYNWMHDRKIEYIRTAGGSARIFADTLFRSAEFQSGNRGGLAANANA